jgi:cellulose synthase/poly-beta-1,6-N-acetylglucosamine synthase-like glycosyltransferase
MQKIRAEHCQSVNRVSENESIGGHQYINQLQSNSTPVSINNSSPEMYNKRQKDNLTLTVSLPTSVYTTTSSSNYKEDKLKIISLKNKPQDWAAKTWASQQGFLHSKGDIIIFTDADTCYVDKNAIKESVSYLLKENLDVLTGFPFIELRDFWSKAVSPVWRLIGIIFGTNLTDINDPKSEAANLNGCFILIGRNIFQKLGTYEAVRNSIREDEALGMRAKRSGYKIGGACMEDSLTALWSRDFRTLWWGIARTIIPIFMDKRRKTKVVSEMLMLFLMGTLPFMILPYASSISAHFLNSVVSHFGFNRNRSDSPQYQLELSAQLSFLILLLDLSACFMLFVGAAGIARRKFKISIVYASISPLSAAFLVIAYVSHLLSLEIAHTDHGKFVEWQGRKYFFYQR